MLDSILFPLRLSLQVSLIATALVGTAGVLMAYITARRDFPGKSLLDIIVTLPLVLPPTVVGYYLVVLLGRRGPIGKAIHQLAGMSFIFTWYGAVIASSIVSFPLIYRAARAAIASVDENLIKASYTLGRSELSTAFAVVLPLAWRGIIAGLALSFARALGEFGATLMIAGNIPGRTNTMPIAIYTSEAAGDRDEANLLVLVLTAVSFLMLYLINRLEGSFGRNAYRNRSRGPKEV
jgi:molybdate transport system permease protein